MANTMDVRSCEHFSQNFAAGFFAQVELQAALAAVVGSEMGAVLAATEAPERIAALRMLNLDDLGPRSASIIPASGAVIIVPSSTT
jgi:hypothetical protein